MPTFPKDLKPGTPMGDAVSLMQSLHAMMLYPDGTFRPAEPITRGQVAVALSAVVHALRGDIQSAHPAVSPVAPATPDIAAWLNRTCMIQAGIGFGAGVWVDVDTILTAAHVVTSDAARKVPLSLNEITLTTYDGKRISAASDWTITLDHPTDRAIIHAPGTGGSSVTFAAPQVGESVWTIGYPLAKPFYVSKGNVSEASMSTLGEPGAFGLSVLDYPGNSGGPVINAKGELVGIVVAGMEAEPAPNVHVDDYAIYAVPPWRG